MLERENPLRILQQDVLLFWTGNTGQLSRWALIRGLRSFSSFLNPATRFELMLDGVINRVCVVALETGWLDDITCERKMNWERVNIVIDRYERLTTSQLRDLRKLQKMAMNPSTDSESVRNQVDESTLSAPLLESVSTDI
nr:unnamed protein product [Haemonchus contortus]